MNKVSVVISAYNEEKNIKRCLDSVVGVADEIIVIDNSSQDETADIAKQTGAKVYSQKNNPAEIDVQKNFGFSKATGDWILSLDADEIITSKLADEIKSQVKNKPEVNGFWIPRKNMIFGKWIKSDMWWPDYQLRLFKRGKGKFDNTVHEPLKVEGQTAKLSNPMIHYNYDSVSQFVTKLNNYTDMEAEVLSKNGYQFSWTDAIRFPLNDFLKTFFLQKGYRDGLHGLVLSLLQAFYMEVVFAKLWEENKFKEVDDANFLTQVLSELGKSAKNISYWITTVKIEETVNPLKKTALKIIRKASRKTNKSL